MRIFSELERVVEEILFDLEEGQPSPHELVAIVRGLARFRDQLLIYNKAHAFSRALLIQQFGHERARRFLLGCDPEMNVR